MQQYKYFAKTADGKTLRGQMAANDEQDLHEKLRLNDQYLIECKEIKKNQSVKRFKSNVISEFSRNIGELVGAGITLLRALKIISEDESIKPKQREVYKEILRLVRSGISFSNALEEQGDAFPPLFISMIRSSESTGNLDTVAMQMATYYEKDYKLTQRVKSAMVYPRILSVMIVIVVAIIMGYVIPQFQSMFEQMETLPLSTTILLGISDFIVHRWYIILLFAIIIFMLVKLIKSIEGIKFYFDKLEIHMPVVGKLKKVIYTARFARTLSSLYSAGIPILSSIEIAKNTIGNLYIESQFDKVIADIRSGDNLSTAIDRVDGFTKKLSSTIMVGEETGGLDSMLVSIAGQMEYESEIALNKLVSMIEPIMIVIMAVIVGFIIISIIKPIYGSYEVIGNMK